MPNWEGSDRRSHLPPNWEKLRKERFKIDGNQCTFVDEDGDRCDSPAEECDHIGDRDDHRISKLRSLCSFHHARKSGREGQAAAAKKRREINRRFRRSEQHPGAL